MVPTAQPKRKKKCVDFLERDFGRGRDAFGVFGSVLE